MLMGENYRYIITDIRFYGWKVIITKISESQVKYGHRRKESRQAKKQM
jgi:hypothetical protein